MADQESGKIVELSHVIDDGMVTYQGLPGPAICDYWTRQDSASNYDDGSSFQIGRIDMVANTGTYVDTPFHRFADGDDLASFPLDRLANLDGLLLHRPFEDGKSIDADAFDGLDVAGKAVIVHTGWDRHWRTDLYAVGHPYLTAAAADRLAEGGARLVGIDSYNIDDTSGRSRPVHSRLLGQGIAICEHMTGLAALPATGFRLTAAPPRIAGMGSFPVRAFALLG